MSKTIYVKCEFCDGVMEIDVGSQEIINKWESDPDNDSEKDKMAAVLRKMEEAKKKRKDLFSETKSQLEGNKRKLSSSFESEVKRIKKEGIKDKPLRPFDLD